MMTVSQRVITVCLCALVVSTEIFAERRNLSDIRYHFTPCGATGRLGPSYEECVQYYTSVDSPITRDGVLTTTYASRFVGSQSFRPPRATEWNLTVAGAAGGRGLCNIERGLGLVQYLDSVRLSTESDLILVAGQKGLGPCDTTAPDPGHMLCENPQVTYQDSVNCAANLRDWLQFNVSAGYNQTLFDFSGGAGGGGASYIGRRGGNISQFRGIIAISAGAGGTSTELFYHFNISSSDLQLYRDYVSGQRTTGFGSYTGGRGYRVTKSYVTAGAGGGYSESLQETLQIISTDGRGLNMSSYFAEGGVHCLDGRKSVPEQFQGAVGGFGGGGGGCLEGGGGGGFTGGSVFNVTQYSPGSGGFSFNSFSVNNTVPEDVSDFNEGDGYVDIVAADCGCVYECDVYEAKDQFECECPNDTQLAPDLSDCYFDDERNVTVASIQVDNTDDDFILQAVSFGGSSFIFSVDVSLSTTQRHSVKRSSDVEGVFCILLFAGEDDDFVLVANPIMGSGRAMSLSEIIDNGTLIMTAYAEFLNSSIFVSGALLASTGECFIEDVIAFNVSTRNITNQDEANFTKIATNLYDPSSSANALLRRLLRITEDRTSDSTTSISPGIIAGIVIAVLVTVGLCVVLTIVGIMWFKRYKPLKSGISMENGQENSVMLTHANLYSGNKRPSADLQANLGYEVLDFAEGESSLPVPGTDQFTSKYGVNAAVFDFTDFNRARSDSELSDWEYPRSKLVFMRDLGEGQFGKVMLMRAMNIAGYTGSIPVAVKTLASRDPAVIQKFMDETELMKRFTHPNIVSLLGVCNMNVSDDSAPLMILEYMPYGDLEGFLTAHRPTEDNPQSLISENHFYDFATDVAKALDFLSSHKYVHRDIAARNCLVGTNLLIKMADFGLARGIYDKDYYRVAGRTFLPVRWMAPECLLYGIFTTASDVWAYGVLLWEITSYGLTPLSDNNAQEIVNMAQDGSLKHSRPTACPEMLYNMMSECHHLNHEDRPSFSDLLRLLETAQYSGSERSERTSMII